MSKKEFYAIGHITNDVLPEPHVGGGVSYTAYAAKQVGYDAHIITKAPEQSRFVKELQALGIVVHCLPVLDPANAEKVTSFANVDDAKGKRKQFVSEVQEAIGMDDLKHFPDMPTSALVMAAPVIGEVSPEVLEVMSVRRRLAATPQGYFRHILPDGSVVRKPWEQMNSLRNISPVVLSNEDISFGEPPVLDEISRFELRTITPLSVITEGADGSEISIRHRRKSIQIQALGLHPRERRDFTGAGDVYALAFLSQLAETQDIVQAGVFASLYAALKIADIANGGNGLATVPSLNQVREFAAYNPRRMRALMADNGIQTVDGLLAKSQK